MAKIREGSYSWAVNLSTAQVNCIRAEFPEKDWGNKSEVIKVVFNDYFKARNKDFPDDEHAYGNQKTGSGKR